MIPPYNENGYLPPGIHKASLEEVIERFGWQSEMRKAQAESLRWLMDLVERLAVQRVVLNGSFVTNDPEPNDVDCALLVDPELRHIVETNAEVRVGLPYIEIDIVDQAAFDFLVNIFFTTDRDSVPKGMIEVIL